MNAFSAYLGKAGNMTDFSTVPPKLPVEKINLHEIKLQSTMQKMHSFLRKKSSDYFVIVQME